MDGWTDRQTGTHRDRHIERWVDRQTDSQTDSQTDKDIQIVAFNKIAMITIIMTGFLNIII